MRPAAARRVTLLVAATLGAGATTVLGETSSWVGRVDGPAEGVERPGPGGRKPTQPKTGAGSVKIIKTVPGSSGAGAAPVASPPSGGLVTTYAKTPPAGDDAAYEAFEQGKYLTALDLARKAADKGEPQAFTLAGRIYEEGLGVAPNAPLAAKWFARGAELGDTEAMFAYGVMLAEGKGIAKDRTAAAKMFQAAAARKHPLANYNLALLFLKGDGKPENPYRAFMHMRFAAEQGITAAQYDLGTLYSTGTGVAANAFEAAKWIGKAAAAGHPDAEVDYAVILFRGHGVPPDPKRGAQFFRAAAEKGVAVAQNRLARCYAYGAGVEKNAVEAAKWHLIAKANGIEDEGLEKVLAGLSKTDRAKAQGAALAWREKSQVGIE